MNIRFQELFPLFMLLLMLSGFLVGGTYLWIKLQVWKAGDRSNFFSLSHDDAMHSKYRQLARAGHVPLWPLYLYWAAVVAAAAFAFGLIATLH